MTQKSPPDILIALSLAYQNGRDYYTGILHYLAQKRRRWNIHLVREGLGLAMLENEARWGLDGAIIDYTVHDDAIGGIRTNYEAIVRTGGEPDRQIIEISSQEVLDRAEIGAPVCALPLD